MWGLLSFGYAPRLASRYHDMADVIDFIVLKQTFDTAVKLKWKVGQYGDVITTFVVYLVLLTD